MMSETGKQGIVSPLIVSEERRYFMKKTVRLFIGSYTNMSWCLGEPGAGLYVCEFDEESGAITCKDAIGGLTNPSFINYSPDRTRMYVVNEVQPINDAIGGITTFGLDADGAVTRLGHTSSYGPSPCFLSPDGDGRFAYLTNYCGDCVVSIACDENGVLTDLVQKVTFTGSGPDGERQDRPHPHSVVIDREERRIAVADLGTDSVHIFDLIEKDGRPEMVLNNTEKIPAGFGPRHSAFNAEGTKLYCTCEMGSAVCAFDYDKASGKLTLLQTIPTLEAPCPGNCCSHIVISPDGRFLYAGNRGHDSLAIFRIDPETGLLTFLKTCDSRGRTPRNFSLDPTGKYMVVADQDSNTVAVFTRSEETGLLTFLDSVHIPSPVFISF